MEALSNYTLRWLLHAALAKKALPHKLSIQAAAKL